MEHQHPCPELRELIVRINSFLEGAEREREEQQDFRSEQKKLFDEIFRRINHLELARAHAEGIVQGAGGSLRSLWALVAAGISLIVALVAYWRS